MTPNAAPHAPPAPQTQILPMQAPQAQPQQPMPAPPSQRPPSIPEILGELQAWDGVLFRSSAGFLSLDRAQRTRKGQLQPGERQAGLPILEWSATLSGTDAMPVGVDLKHVDPNYLDHVIVPLQAALASELLDAIGEIKARIAMLEPMLQGVLPRAA